MINASVEEGVYRGVLFSALSKVYRSTFFVIILQAIAFGLLHINGFPRGWSGVALASIYGLFMGFIRFRSRGLLAPWLTHVTADMTIVLILIFLN